MTPRRILSLLAVGLVALSSSIGGIKTVRAQPSSCEGVFSVENTKVNEWNARDQFGNDLVYVQVDIKITNIGSQPLTYAQVVTPLAGAITNIWNMEPVGGECVISPAASICYYETPSWFNLAPGQSHSAGVIFVTPLGLDSVSGTILATCRAPAAESSSSSSSIESSSSVESSSASASSNDDSDDEGSSCSGRFSVINTKVNEWKSTNANGLELFYTQVEIKVTNTGSRALTYAQLVTPLAGAVTDIWNLQPVGGECVISPAASICNYETPSWFNLAPGQTHTAGVIFVNAAGGLPTVGSTFLATCRQQ
eukprot:TRINITY_DN352_c0_g2_i1.p1 TRINITY_DN352_c0_g2~~TRINITY_DN352_c0_g2_i1.p1  ORF type:complete len:340 (+),score=92.52 TRINITY_DN352_c0_g2_i1:94-1020(+)